MSEEFESKWKAKCKAAVAVVTKAAEEKLAEAEKAKEQLDSKLEIIQNKVREEKTFLSFSAVLSLPSSDHRR